MEAIKFSELPTGDRMPLADEDGVPIIANQENRLLTWGRLKKQLAAQTHTDEVKPDDTKVPTSAAVENRIATAEDDLQDKLEPLETKLNEHDTAIESTRTLANEAKTAAETASSTASGAQSVAESAASIASAAQAAATAAQNTADGAASAASSAQNAIAEATSNISAVSNRLTSIETKIENGEIGGAAEEVDLTPITGRLDTIESKDTAQDGRLDAVESKNTAQDGRLDALEAKTESQDSAISAAQTSATTANAAATTAQNTADAAKVAAIVESLSAHKLVYAEGTGDNAGAFAFNSTTENLTNATLATLVAHYNANFQSLATYIENHPDGLDEVVTIAKGINLRDSLLDGDGHYNGKTTFQDQYDSDYTLWLNSDATVTIALNVLFHNNYIMFQMLRYILTELNSRKNDVDTVVKNINSVFAQVMN